MTTDLRLNFTPLEIHGEAIEFQSLAFRDHEQLRALRQAHAGRFAFTRRASKIIALPLVEDAEKLGERTRSVIADQLSLLRPLVEQRLISMFAANNRRVAGYNPITVVGRPLPTGYPAIDDWLVMRQRVLVSIRMLELEASEPMLGLLWDREIERDIPASLAQLAEAGLSSVDAMVETEFASVDARFVPHRRLIGRVDRIDGAYAVLGERRPDAPDRMSLGDLYLEASNQNTRALIKHFAPGEIGDVWQRLDEVVHHEGRGASKQKRIEEISQWARSTGPLMLQPGSVVSQRPS